MSTKRFFVAVSVWGVIGLLTLGLSGCASSSQPIGVGLTPSAKSIDQAQTVPMTASVTHDAQGAGVQWTVTGGGTLSAQTATSATYNAPASVTSGFTATVTATSATDNSKSATLQIKVSPPPAVTTTSLPAATAGTAYSATLLESGGSSPFTWSVTAGSLPAGLTFNSSTGVISGTPTGASSGSVTFQVADTAGMSASQAITVTVNAPPALTITTTTFASGTIGTAYSQTAQAAGGVPTYKWSVTSGGLPAGLTLNATTGVISGTPSGTFTGTSNFTLTVTDSQTPTAATKSTNLSITISAPALSVTTTSLAAGSIGTAYNQTLQAAGGITPYTWAVTTGSLPAGLTLNAATGMISGTPSGTFVGTVNFTVTVTDAETPTGKTASANLSITISVAALSVTTTSLPQGIVNSVYAGATLQATGGITPYSWAVTTGSLPAGLSLNASTGAISGTPTAAGTTNFTVTVTDSETPTAKSATVNLSITVNPAVSVTTTSLAAGVIGTAYNQTLQAAGGLTPYTWAITTGSLPAGLSLNTSTGVISGTPSGTFVGTTLFTVTVSDSESPKKTASANLSITITTPALSVTTTLLPAGTIGMAYSQTLQATGGITPYTWAVTTGSLPAGLILNPATGMISGSPSGTFVGTVNFTVTVTDSETPTAKTASANLSITISVAPLSVTTTSGSLPQGIVNSVYAGATLQATGGITPYLWAVTTGSLPAGLSLNSATGAISGTPTASGSVTFTVTVTDSETPTAKTASVSLTIVVNPAVSVTTTSLATGVIGTAYNQTLQAAGGLTPYTWAITTGSLPAGLSLNVNTGAITGTPTGPFVGVSSFTVTVSDSESPKKTASANLSITISATTLKVTTTSLPNGVVNNSYSATLQASGGVSSYTWAVTTGSLPVGLSLDSSTGAITGTPTTTGTSNFTVTVTDAETPTAQTATANLSISINNSAPLVITTSGLPGGVVNTPYLNAVLQASGGVQPYTWSISAGTLPAGLILNAATGTITGTPTATGTSNFTVKVTDSTQPTHLTQTANLSISISAALAITATTLPDGSIGVQYNATVNATGGLQPYSWSISSGNLPPGLSVSNNNNSANISGQPTTTGTYTFTLQVTDSESPQVSVSATFSISISQGAPLAITSTTLPAGDKNWPYSTSLKATGGVQSYTWSITVGSLPAGLSFDANTGNISGTPTATGTTNFTITVTDSESPAVTASASVSIVIGNCGNNANLNGHYVFMTNGWKNATDASASVGSFVANGAGTITSGLLDFNDLTKGPQSATATGTYCVSSNNLVAVSLSTNSGGTGTFEAALDTTGNGHITRYDSTSAEISSGLLRKQQTTAFTTGEITGNYAFGFIGADSGGINRFGMAGQFNSTGAGTLSGEVDADDTNGGGVHTTLSASNFNVASTGRGTVSIAFAGQGSLNFVFYVVNATELLVMEDDGSGNPLIAGQVLQQSGTFTNASLSGVSVVEVQTGGNNGGAPSATLGLVTTTGNTGTFTFSADQNDGGTTSTQSDTGTFSVASNGRVTLASSGGGSNPIFYLVAKNQAFLIGTGGGVDSGMLLPQSGTSFTNASLSGNYLGGSQQPVNTNVSTEVNSVNSDGAGNFSVTTDNNSNGCNGGVNACPDSNSVSVTYSVSSNGRVLVSQGGTQVGIIYIVSTSQVAFLPVDDSNPKLSDFHK